MDITKESLAELLAKHAEIDTTYQATVKRAQDRIDAAASTRARKVDRLVSEATAEAIHQWAKGLYQRATLFPSTWRSFSNPPESVVNEFRDTPRLFDLYRAVDRFSSKYDSLRGACTYLNDIEAYYLRKITHCGDVNREAAASRRAHRMENAKYGLGRFKDISIERRIGFVERQHPSVKWTTVQGTIVPADDVTQCGRCGENTFDTMTVGGVEWCRECASNHSHLCAETDERVPDEQWSGELPAIEGYIAGYHGGCRMVDYMPTYGRELYGIELEVLTSGDRDYVAELAADQGFQPEEDGSLDESYGIELIGPPMTLEESRRTIPLLMNSIGNDLDEPDVENYGCHITFNAHGHSPIVVGRMLQILYNSQRLTCAVGGRRPNSWASYVPLTSDRQRKAAIEFRKGHGWGRGAINIRSMRAVELRIFASSMSAIDIVGRVEFVDAAWQYAKRIDGADAEAIKGYRFRDWLGRNIGEYPSLAAILRTEACRNNGATLTMGRPNRDPLRLTDSRGRVIAERAFPNRATKRHAVERGYVSLTSSEREY